LTRPARCGRLLLELKRVETSPDATVVGISVLFAL
jgi:hypothetical protein